MNQSQSNGIHFHPNDDNMTLLSVEEAAAMLSCGRNRIYELLKSKKINGIRLGTKTWRIPKVAVYEFIQKEAKLFSND